MPDDSEEQSQKIALHLDKSKNFPEKSDDCPSIVGDDEKHPKTSNSTISHDGKRILRSTKKLRSSSKRKVYGHNFSLRFPLQSSCKIPFAVGMKKISLRFTEQYILETPEAFIRQTSKNLIVFPRFEELPATPGNSVELRGKLRAKAIVIVRALQAQHRGLRVFAPDGKPSTQEYAVKDPFAAKLDFTFKNELGKFDKSKRKDPDGHVVTGGEIEYFTPEHADMYLKMPIIFSSALAGYTEQINLHLSVLQDMKESLRQMRGSAAPRPFRSSLRRSATVSGVS